MNEERSEFNAVIEFMKDLRYCWRGAMQAAQECNPGGWYDFLMALSRRLMADMNEQETNEDKEYRDKLQPMVMKATRNYDASAPKIDNALYNLLSDYEIFLSKVEKRAGYRAPYSDEAMRALR